jgi:hypothetical protein
MIDLILGDGFAFLQLIKLAYQFMPFTIQDNATVATGDDGTTWKRFFSICSTERISSRRSGLNNPVSFGMLAGFPRNESSRLAQKRAVSACERRMSGVLILHSFSRLTLHSSDTANRLHRMTGEQK